ncbi:MAG TPA: GNAT family N-acetyltransferase [Ktedonobacterales bacterium]|nr:GNAT family N-acetyltransferase [Ktedonobacterales bacterium]
MSQQDETRSEIPRLTIEDAPDEADVRFVEERIDAYNVAATGYDDYRPVAIFVRDSEGAIMAGLTGFTWGGTLKVEFFWVRDDLRGQGYGSRLIEAAEREAVARGCRQAVLDTHSFQAPDFYPRLGYVRCGLAEDWPLGHQQIYFQKRLQ